MYPPAVWPVEALANRPDRTNSPPGFIPHTVLFPLDTSIPILSMGIPSFLIKYCNASAPAYYDSIWFVTRTRHNRSNLLNRIFITRGRRTVYSSNAWLIKEAVHPLPSHYNKNKHSFRGFLYASGAMLILYQTKNIFMHSRSFYNKNIANQRTVKAVLHAPMSPYSALLYSITGIQRQHP